MIIIGEHSVVYGYDALAMPIKALHIKTTVEDSDQMWMIPHAIMVLSSMHQINTMDLNMWLKP